MKKYIQICIELNSDNNIHAIDSSFALVQWFDEHPERHTLYSAPVEVWRPSAGNQMFVPVASIVGRVAVMETDASIVFVPLFC